MKFLRKIQIAAASALVGLSLYGCSQQALTTSAPSTNQDTTAQPTAQMMSPTPTNNQPVTRNGTISHQQRAGLHDGCVTAAGDHDADFHKSVADDRTPACHAIIAWEHGAGECHRPGCRSGPRQPPGIGPTATGWGKHPIVPRTVFVVIIFNETQAFPCK